MRLKLLKIGAQIRITVRKIWVSLSTGYPYLELFRQVHGSCKLQPCAAEREQVARPVALHNESGGMVRLALTKIRTPGARTASKTADEGPHDDFRILTSLCRRLELLFAATLPRCETFGLDRLSNRRNRYICRYLVRSWYGRDYTRAASKTMAGCDPVSATVLLSPSDLPLRTN